VEELTTDDIVDVLKKFIRMGRGDRKSKLTDWLLG
jgi:hypothetical protein